MNRLVVNGCSYMKYYADGQGHVNLANKLGLAQTRSLARNGSCNHRIIRTTLQDSFRYPSTFYVLGISFLTRFELPILLGSDDIEGKWISFTTSGGTSGAYDFDRHIDSEQVKSHAEFWNTSTVLGLEDLMDDLMYRIISMIDSLVSRGHQVLIFNTAEHTVEYYIDKSRFHLLRSSKNIIDGLKWRSIPWQFQQGAQYLPEDDQYPWDSRHVKPGDHGCLNSYLLEYIQEHKLTDF